MYLKQLSLALGVLLLCCSLHAETVQEPEPAHIIEQPRYISFPTVIFSDEDLQGVNRWLLLEVVVDEEGYVFKAVPRKSSGIPWLDARIIKRMKARARLQPMLVDGKAVPSYAYQKIELAAERPKVSWPIPETLQYVPAGTPTRDYRLLSLTRVGKQKLQYSRSAAVIISAYIGRNGRVLQLAVKQPDPDNRINYAAVQALLRCVFQPVLENGEPIAYTTDIPMYFYTDYANVGVISPAPELLPVTKGQGKANKAEDKATAPAVTAPAGVEYRE